MAQLALRRVPKNYELLLKEMERAPYLREYLNKVAPTLGYPDFYAGDIPSELKKAPNVNILYPLGEGIYVHVYTPLTGTVSGYRKYVAIEPPRPPRELFDLVESKMAEFISEKDIAVTPEEKKRLLLSLLERIVRVVNERVNYRSLLRSKGLKYVPVYRDDYEYLKYYFIRDKVGLGVLEPFIKDPYIEDISCDGVGFIYLVHKIFGPLETNIGFKTEEELDRFVIELSERIGKPVSHARPIVDATLPDGSRINIVFGADVSLKGSNFTIRKFSKKPISVIQLIKWGTLDERVAAYLWILLLEGMSGFISGETASGKTTSLNAIIAFIRPSAKIITIEDTAEVQVPHENWVRELTRDTGSVESSVTMFDLLKAALRQRPNYIIVGEIRGAEGNVAFQAMQSVAWETPVLIWRETATKPELVPIGEFVDSLYMTSYTNDGKPVMISGNCKVLTLNREGKLSWGNIAYVLRHRVDHAYEIIYGDDYKLIATGSHSVYVLDLNSMLIVPKPVTMIREGDLLVTFKSSLSLNIIHSSRIYDEFLKTLWIKGSNAFVCNTYLKGIIKVLRGIADKYGIDIDVGLKSISEAKHGEDVNGKLHDLVTTVISRIKGLRIKRNDLALLERIKMLVNSDICFLPVKFVRRISYEGYVYDISVPPMELFIGGVKPIALHNTGHPVLATFHAGSVLRLIQRITSPPINVPKTQLDNLNFVIIQSAVYREGVMLRRMLSVNEILGYDAVADSVIYIPVFTWDPSTDRFLFRGRGASYLLEEKIATMRGIPRREIKLIYEELDLRAKILRELVKRNITDYYQVFKIFAKIFMVLDEMLKGKGKEETQYTILEGLENILKLIRRGEFI